jgi:hypothetical protein
VTPPARPRSNDTGCCGRCENRFAPRYLPGGSRVDDRRIGKGGFGKGGGGGFRADAGYGSVVDAGSVIITLTPNGELMVWNPSGKELQPVARYQLGAPGTYAYPVVAGKRIFVKDADAITLWTIE